MQFWSLYPHEVNIASMQQFPWSSSADSAASEVSCDVLHQVLVPCLARYQNCSQELSQSTHEGWHLNSNLLSFSSISTHHSSGDSIATLNMQKISLYCIVFVTQISDTEAVERRFIYCILYSYYEKCFWSLLSGYILEFNQELSVHLLWGKSFYAWIKDFQIFLLG